MTDNLPNIGETPNSTHRDAIHIAVVPCAVSHYEAGLKPGALVRISHVQGTAHAYQTAPDDHWDGVVDPFRTEPAMPGQMFWLFLRPGTITHMRHHWSHPVFPANNQDMGGDRAESEAWLRDYAHRYCADYDQMLDGAVSGRGYCFGDDDGPPNYRGAGGEFWHHIEVVTGRKYGEQHRKNTVFRCGC